MKAYLKVTWTENILVCREDFKCHSCNVIRALTLLPRKQTGEVHASIFSNITTI